MVQTRVARGSDGPAGRVQFDFMTKIYCKIVRCLSYYTYNNVLNIFHVVVNDVTNPQQIVYIRLFVTKTEHNKDPKQKQTDKHYKCGFCIDDCLSPAQLFDRSTGITCKCRSLLCCLRSTMWRQGPPFVSYCYIALPVPVIKLLMPMITTLTAFV